ncbi:MAG TPA: DALR domain-containing protein, partial [Oscillospiraceae bacterium]|nr:DALR domain-containing protein [Oscillospiraceae bacterium]
AQSECATGHELARYWMHNGMISVDNSKMSKSKGNFFLVRDVAKQYGYEVIRFFVLQSHYRNPINYSTDSIEAAKAGLERIYNCRETLERALSDAPQGKLSDNIKQSTTSYKEQFAAAMEDDLNTADAFGVMFELVREINTALTGEYNHSDLECYAAQLDEIAGVLGLLYNLKVEEKIPESVMALVEKRKEARAAKDFATADSLRDQIAEMGYAIEETRQGTIVSKKA